MLRRKTDLSNLTLNELLPKKTTFHGDWTDSMNVHKSMVKIRSKEVILGHPCCLMLAFVTQRKHPIKGHWKGHKCIGRNAKCEDVISLNLHASSKSQGPWIKRIPHLPCFLSSQLHTPWPLYLSFSITQLSRLGQCALASFPYQSVLTDLKYGPIHPPLKRQSLIPCQYFPTCLTSLLLPWISWFSASRFQSWFFLGLPQHRISLSVQSLSSLHPVAICSQL